MTTEKTYSNRQALLAILVLLLVAGALFAIWRSQNDPRTEELNSMLANDFEVSEFEYPFRVFRVEGNTAVVSTPRSPQMSVLQYLKIAHPELDLSNPDRPEVIAAQKALANTQSHVRKLILSHPTIDDVRWELDRHWFLQHGVDVR